MSSPALPSATFVNVAPITSLLNLEVSPDTRLNQLPKDLIKYILLPMLVIKSRQDYKFLRDLKVNYEHKYQLNVSNLQKNLLNKNFLQEYLLDSDWQVKYPLYEEPYFQNALNELDKLVGQEIRKEIKEKEEYFRRFS